MTNLWAASNHAARDGIVLSRRPCRSHPPHAHLFVQTLITRVKFTTWRAQRSTDRSAETYAGRHVFFRHDMLVIYFASDAVAVDSSRMIASSSASWSRFSPPSNFFQCARAPRLHETYAQYTPPRQTRQNSPVCVVSGVPVWIGRLLWTRSHFKFSVGDSLELSEISSHHRRGRDTDKTVLSCLAWRCEFAFTHF